MRFMMVMLLLTCLGGCSESEPTVVVDMTKVETLTPPGPDRAITYAYLPQYSHSVSFERHRRLLDYLRLRTGLPIRQIFPASFSDHIQMVERGEIDISFCNPFVYTTLARTGAEAFARVMEPEGGAVFQGQIIVRADNRAINTLEDCRGKRLIAVDPDSAGGFLYPLGLFYDHGLTRSDFRDIAFAAGSGGKQEAVVLAVYAGAYDVGTIRKGTLDVVQDKIDVSQIHVLAETQPYPGWVYASRRGFDPAIRAKIAQAMYALNMGHEDDALILSAAGMIGIIPAHDTDFDSIRTLVRRLGLREEQP